MNYFCAQWLPNSCTLQGTSSISVALDCTSSEEEGKVKYNWPQASALGPWQLCVFLKLPLMRDYKWPRGPCRPVAGRMGKRLADGKSQV